MQQKKTFHRHFATPGLNLYWIIIAYIIIGWFYPVVGLIALICMIGPVMTSIWKGRWWCGNVCPRGNMYDRLLSKYSPHKPIPAFVRTFGFARAVPVSAPCSLRLTTAEVRSQAICIPTA